MKKLLAGAIAVGVVSTAGVLGNGTSAAETALLVGGAKVPGVPWYDYTLRAGRLYYPDATRVIVDYPAGMLQGRLLEPYLPGLGLDSLGESVAVGENNLDAAIRGTGGPTVAIGMSEGTLVLDEEQARLAHDPTAPPPDRLSFAQFSSPSISHGFGKSFMTAIFPPGTFVPVVDYTMPKPVESQYDTTIVAAAYDGFADFPDRPENLISVANSLVGAAIVHTPAAFTGPANVPPQNIRTTTNSRGATTTTYLLPAKYLPLTMPLHYAGVPDDITAQIDAALRPMVDAGYSRNDNPATAPINVDPAAPDPIATILEPVGSTLEPGAGVDLDAALQQIRNLLPAGG